MVYLSHVLSAHTPTYGGEDLCNIEKVKKIENYFDNSFKLQTSTKTKNDTLTVICSRSHPNDEFEQWLTENIKQFLLLFLYR